MRAARAGPSRPPSRPAPASRTVTRLRTLAGKLERDVFRLTRFPLHRFLRLRINRQEAVGNEGDVTDLIRESVGLSAQLSAHFPD